MNIFLKSISYIFHPLFTAVFGALFYFFLTPKYNSSEQLVAIILPIFILTVVIPIIVYYILKNMGVTSSIFIPHIKERKYPMYVHIVLLLIILYKITPNALYIELHYFFIGLLLTAMTSLFLIFFNFKSSMHLAGMGSLIMFLTSISIHFEINITFLLSLFTLMVGLVTTSRLYMKAHTKIELLIGFLIGLLPQLLTIKFWL